MNWLMAKSRDTFRSYHFLHRVETEDKGRVTVTGHTAKSAPNVFSLPTMIHTELSTVSFPA